MNETVSSADGGGVPLREQMIRECDAMARHALASGMAVPGALVEQLAALTETRAPVPEQTGEASAAAVGTVQSAGDLAKLTAVHQRLTKIVAPSTPRTILLLAEESAKPHLLGFLGPVPLIRHMMLAAIVSLVSLVGLSLSPLVSANPDYSSVMTSSGVPLLMNELFYISAAALGASFAALFKANRYIADCTFDPKYKASYWINFVLGIIAGWILADLLPELVSDPAAISGAQPSSGPAALSTSVLSKPLLAILGGFSASVVYRILTRLVDAIESLFSGDPRDRAAAEAKAVSAKGEAQRAQSDLKLAANLAKLQQQLQSGSSPQQLSQQLQQIVATLVPAEAATVDEHPAPPPHTDAATAPGKPAEASQTDSPTAN